MDLNEARKVLWIRPNRRPLGELMDEGLLSRGQLEWAANNAYSSELQEAAKTLLLHIDKSPPITKIENKATQLELPKLDIPISVDQAKATIWPFKHFRGEQMGSLVSEKKISLADLGYAIENAWDQKVRNAALVLSAVRMNQIVKEPRPPKGHVAVFSKGRSFSSRRQLDIVQVRGGVIGFVFGILIFWLVTLLFGKYTANSTTNIGDILASPSGIIVLIIFFAIVIGMMIFVLFTVDRTVKEFDELAELYRKGEEGEDRVADVIKRTLNGDWSLFQNMTIPGRRGGDFDAVIVGPTGVWNLEVKALSGKFRNIGDSWQCLEKKKWQNVKRNPSAQARKNALRLKGLFEADHISTYVKPIVVWANPESPLAVENPTVAIWKLDRLEDELGNIQEGKSLSEEDRKKICEKLAKLVERGKR
jgi:hypothetical protein